MIIIKKNRRLLALLFSFSAFSPALVYALAETENLLGAGYAAYDAKNYADAATAFRRAAEKGHAGAMHSLAQMYHKGQGVPQDDAQALQWNLRAAAKGHEEAMINVAQAYETGVGSAKNTVESVRWYLQAAAAGYAEGMFMAGKIYEQGRPAAAVAVDTAQARAWYQKAREAGNEAALPRLLLMALPTAPQITLKPGIKGPIERVQSTGFALAGQGRYDEAFSWWYYAAAKAESAAMYNLGLLYFNGWGVKKSEIEALRWWLAAAELGHAAAMYDVGVMQENGWGLPRDIAAARFWYGRARNNNFSQADMAINALDISSLLERAFMAEHNKAWAESQNYFEQAVKAGSVEAMTALGRMYENGSGVARDKTMAISWYQKAVAANNTEAMFRLAVMYHDVASPDMPAASTLYRQIIARSPVDLDASDAKTGDAKTAPSIERFWRDSAIWRLQDISMKSATPRFRREYQSAVTGYAPAMVKLGDFYDQAQEGVAQNTGQAFLWWQAAALRGYAPAMTLTGLHFISGNGVQKNSLKGLEWLSNAALLRDLTAMAALVDVYRKGNEEIPADPRKSAYWLDRYTAGQRASRQVHDDEVLDDVPETEQQSHAYLLQHNAQYAALFKAPASQANDRVVAKRVLPLPLNLWDAGGGHYVVAREVVQEGAQGKTTLQKNQKNSR